MQEDSGKIQGQTFISRLSCSTAFKRAPSFQRADGRPSSVDQTIERDQRGKIKGTGWFYFFFDSLAILWTLDGLATTDVLVQGIRRPSARFAPDETAKPPLNNFGYARALAQPRFHRDVSM